MDRLKQLFKSKYSVSVDEIKALVKESGSMVIDQVQIDQVYGGMRGIQSMIWETSSLDAKEGIRFRGYSIAELREKLPQIHGATEPLPEGLFWLMMTGEIPTDDDVAWLSQEWARRAEVPASVFTVLDSLSPSIHPMTQFTIAILTLQTDSVFARR